MTFDFTWFEVSRWTLNKKETVISFSYAPEICDHIDILLKTDQAEFFLSGVLEFVKILQVGTVNPFSCRIMHLALPLA